MNIPKIPSSKNNCQNDYWYNTKNERIKSSVHNMLKLGCKFKSRGHFSLSNHVDCKVTYILNWKLLRWERSLLHLTQWRICFNPTHKICWIYVNCCEHKMETFVFIRRNTNVKNANIKSLKFVLECKRLQKFTSIHHILSTFRRIWAIIICVWICVILISWSTIHALCLKIYLWLFTAVKLVLV